jgi:hypothetical protein
MFGLLGQAVAAVVSLCAQEAPATNPRSGKVVTAYFEYQDANYSYANWGLPLAPKAPVFKKEPVFSRSKVTRGAWQLGGGVGNDVGFAWDRTAGKLYVDLNGDLDLTDDPAGVFSSDKGAQDNFQGFPNVRLPIKAGTASRQMLVDLSFYDYGARANCTAAVHSFWQGKVILQREEWQAGMLGMLTDQRPSLEAGNLLLRPWAERNKPFNVDSGSLAALTVSRKVLLKPNRCASAWWVLVPLGCVAGVASAPQSVLELLPSSQFELFTEWIGALGFGLAALWLLSSYLR